MSITPTVSKASSDRPRRGRSWKWIVGTPALLLLAASASLMMALRQSLPVLEGREGLPGLAAEVRVDRDANGVPSVTAAGRADLARAVGFLHGQDRFFQMDLLRRAAAGELPALLGPGLLENTWQIRAYQLRDTARQALARCPESEKALLSAYADGVNAGVAALGARPPEYLLLRQRPQPWLPEDSLLVMQTMGLQLSDPFGAQKVDRAIARKSLPPVVHHFYVRADTVWPATLDGSVPPTPPMPSATDLDLRQTAAESARQELPAEGRKDRTPGSNAFAVTGRRTRDGRALVANDMHLGLSLPNVWHRMDWHWRTAAGEPRRAIGVTLPGSPAMIAGSNTRVAWGVTASQLDVSDQVVLETDPAHPGAFRVGDEWRPLRTETLVIPVAGSTNRILTVLQSPWGPVSTNALGQVVALRWAMQLPEALNLRFLGMEDCSTVSEVQDLAPQCGLPWVNVIAGDTGGHIGWTLAGRFPRRTGLDPHVPSTWSDGVREWNGWYGPDELPHLLDPAGDALWNANNRALETPAYLRVAGADFTDNGARASQIRDRLLSLTNATPADLLDLQLDDRAVMLTPWQERLMAVLDRSPDTARFSEARPLVASWGARASVDSVGYRLVRAFRLQVHDLLLSPIRNRCRDLKGSVHDLPGQQDGAVEDLLAKRPPHLLPKGYASYDDLLQAAASKALALLPDKGPLALRTWGERNRVHLRHPFSLAMPFLGRWLDAPARSLPGDSAMPRVQAPSFGASERLVVSPGREREGIFHMPGGQSGHFLSPFYIAGQRDWEEGRATPLVPGPTRYSLTLAPQP